MSRKAWTKLGAISLASVFILALALPVTARDAAFMDPGSAGGAGSEDAIKVEPKGDIDVGDSVLNVARRTTLFFVNQTNLPVKVEKMDVNNDGNVAAEITNDDCSRQGAIAPQSRCSVEVSVTPSSPGPWSISLLLTHNGAGRIARAKLSGKTGGNAEKKDTGLALSTKDIPPVNFGDVEVGQGKAVRSALMVNDSPDSITLYSIDVIEAGNGLQRLDQGCAIDMELKPGESCPVTLIWTPTANGLISTDLIIRHSGRLGFAVIPIRGSAKGGSADVLKNDKPVTDADAGKKSSIPLPPSAQDLEKAATGKIPPVSADVLTTATKSTTNGPLRLIGTVGNRAVLLLPDGTTSVAGLHDEIAFGDKSSLKVTAIHEKSADVIIDGKKKTITLESAPEITSKAASLRKDNESSSASSNAAGLNSSATIGAPVAIPAVVSTLPPAQITPLGLPIPTGGVVK